MMEYTVRIAYLISAVVLYLASVLFYRCFLGPLAKFPGPVAAKLTDLYMIASAITFQNTYKRHELHQKYGDIVRVGPKELCFCNEESIKDICGQTAEPCMKWPPFYKGFSMTGTESVFSTTDRHVHARMRRLLSHGFSQQGVLHYQHQIAEMVQRFTDIVETAGQPVEFHDLIHHLFEDIISQLAFAKSFDTLSGNANQTAADIDTYFAVCPMFGLVPWARYLPFGPFLAAKQSQVRIKESIQRYIDEFRARLRAGTTEKGLLRHMIEAKDEETGTIFSDSELIENGVIFILAGTGTSTTTVIYILYELAKRPEMQKRLEEEIRQAFPDPSVLPDYDSAQKLPYLNCVLQETLRLRGPLPTVSPRVSPGKNIAGHYIPQGTIVGSLVYTRARNPTVFPRPEEYYPERWESPTPAMQAMSTPFSLGARNCIGMHLARVQVILATCALYQRFDLTLDASVTEDMMKMRDCGLMNPMGKKLWMHAKARH